MPSYVNVWTTILSWFQDWHDRRQLIVGFNRSAKAAFISGDAPVILEARVSRGDRAYKHRFSNLFNSGFRIKACAGYQLSRQDTINIGNVVLSNEILIRRLVVLGFDTLEVHSDVGTHGCKWQLKDYLLIGNGGNDVE